MGYFYPDSQLTQTKLLVLAYILYRTYNENGWLIYFINNMSETFDVDNVHFVVVSVFLYI